MDGSIPVSRWLELNPLSTYMTEQTAHNLARLAVLLILLRIDLFERIAQMRNKAPMSLRARYPALDTSTSTPTPAASVLELSESTVLPNPRSEINLATATVTTSTTSSNTSGAPSSYTTTTALPSSSSVEALLQSRFGRRFDIPSRLERPVTSTLDRQDMFDVSATVRKRRRGSVNER